MNTLTGIVKWWDKRKGYGYITVALNGAVQDYFAHYANIESSHKFKKLKEGWVCEFVPEKSEKGWMATGIHVVARDSKDFPNLKETDEWLQNNEY